MHSSTLSHPAAPLRQLGQAARQALSQALRQALRPSRAPSLRLVAGAGDGMPRVAAHPSAAGAAPHRLLPSAAAAHATDAYTTARKRPLPLRVVRVVEGEATGTPAGGRMRISGRMADVCAELERLAEREAAFQKKAALAA